MKKFESSSRAAKVILRPVIYGTEHLDSSVEQRRSVVAFARVDFQLVAVFCSLDVHGMVSSVRFGGSGLVVDHVAATESLLKVGQTSIEAPERARRKDGAARLF